MSNVTKDFEKRWRYRYKIETENVIKRCNALNKQAKVTTYILNKKEMNEFIENMNIY